MNSTFVSEIDSNLHEPAEDKDFYALPFTISWITSGVVGIIIGIITALAKHSFRSFGLPAGPIICLVLLLLGIISSINLHRSDKSISQGECITSIIAGEIIGYLVGYSLFFWLVRLFFH
jgi:hypothetical protein